MIHRIRHTTIYDYAEPVALSHHLARLTPRPTERQRARAYRLTVSPEPQRLAEELDWFGNPTTYFQLAGLHRRLVIEAVAEVETSPQPLPTASPPWEAAARGPFEFRQPSQLVSASAAAQDYAWPSFAPGRPLLEAVTELVRRIHRDFTFDPAATTVATPVEEVLRLRRGVCQDFAHLAIACLRSFAIPARYLSGYVETQPPPGQPRLVGADASHAWLAFWCPLSADGGGDGVWIEADPTNDSVPADRHVTLAWGRDFDDVSPLKGVILGGGSHAVQVAVDMVPIT